MRIAIYDFDRTLTRRATFTPFLIFAARRVASWRLTLLPLWLFAMLAYRLGAMSRARLKLFGMQLLVGRRAHSELEALGSQFAARVLADDGLMPGTLHLLEEDRKAGARLILATAAFDVYAKAFATALRFDEVVATRWEGFERVPDNCYADTKLASVLDRQPAIGEARTRFVSDSFADAPLLDRVSEPIFATTSNRKAKKAAARGWRVIDPREI
ncbi:HAD-IB family phosphatase [Erythrobacter pelagi]|uniref:HAD-IB family phosphatase n=1 Tax=Qipengyuania pelagi TaxID=994320 RepID=A0A844Y900_9SPHN|nr:HAD-IB family phosphatase [Qipengyuania pelagi]MXO53498.1 HAD-IB family phosphatase [Qipengyuania pelagi]